MAQVQAIVLSCSEPELTRHLPEFFENQLNLYAVDPRVAFGGVKIIFEGGVQRDEMFNQFNEAFVSHEAAKIILINHMNCSAYADKQQEVQEIQLRHGVSAFHARFPDKDVEAYLAIQNGESLEFRKIV